MQGSSRDVSGDFKLSDSARWNGRQHWTRNNSINRSRLVNDSDYINILMEDWNLINLVIVKGKCLFKALSCILITLFTTLQVGENFIDLIPEHPRILQKSWRWKKPTGSGRKPQKVTIHRIPSTLVKVVLDFSTLSLLTILMFYVISYCFYSINTDFPFNTILKCLLWKICKLFVTYVCRNLSLQLLFY